MPRYEDKTAEQIWQTIEALKRSPNAASQNDFQPVTPSDPEADDLIPLAASLATIFEEESQASSGQTTGRLRLQAVIQADLASRPVSPRLPRKPAGRFTWSRNMVLATFLLLLALMALGISLWATSRMEICNPPSINAASGSQPCHTDSPAAPQKAHSVPSPNAKLNVVAPATPTQ